MKMKNNETGKNDRMDRRSMVKNGTILIGTGFLGSFATPLVEPPEKANNNFFNVRDFGATGNRSDNATMPIRSAIDACKDAGGGTVYVPPGDYTVGILDHHTGNQRKESDKCDDSTPAS